MDSSNPISGDEPPSDVIDQPDIMNDPAYDTYTQRNEKNSEDAETCRICRGEGSPREPLFYPCRCSGSIKFVHQNCLMEWLTHSNKKHCELCKTPFRFTKLYDAHMPKSVPVPVFLRQAAKHMWRTLLTWSRLHLVAFVWIFWLPWCMRAVWRGLFWIGDGSWVDWRKRNLQDAIASIARQDFVIASAFGTATTSNSRETNAAALVSQFSSKLSEKWTPVTQMFTFRQEEPLTFRLLKRFYLVFFGKATVGASLSETNVTAIVGATPRSATWLSEIPLLKSLTRSTIVNNIIIDTLEGQIITMFIVVGFILIFLIREWVMQQHQNLLIGLHANQDPVGPQIPVGQAQERAELQADEQGAGAGAVRQLQALPDGEDNGVIVGPAVRVLARPRRRFQGRATRPEAHETSQNEGTFAGGPAVDDIDIANEESVAPQFSQIRNSDSNRRPLMPDRGVIARAVEIRRTLDEHSRTLPDHDGSEALVFKDLWSRAEQDPSEVLRIIELENRTEELDWIVNFMRKLEGAPLDLRMSAAIQVDDGNKHDQQNLAVHHEDQASDAESLEIGDDQKPSPSPSPSRSRIFPRRLKDWGDRSPSPPRRFEDKVGNDAGREVQMSGASTSASRSDDRSPAQVGRQHPAGFIDAEQQGFEEALGGAPTHETSITRQHPSDDEPASPETSLQEGDDVLQDSVIDGAPEPSPPSQSVLERLMDLMWGGIPPPNDQVDQPAGDDERVVNDIANEAPFVRVAHGQHLIPAQNEAPNPGQDPDVVAAAAQAGVDPDGGEGIDEIEDLEGIMELIGMQGPLIGLVQNGLICALLVSLAMAAGLWVPYIFGKVFLTMLDHPSHVLKQPLRFASASADMIVDFCIFAAGCLFFWADLVFGMLCAPVGWLIPPIGVIARNKVLAETAKAYAERAIERLAKASLANGDLVARVFDVPKFSVIAHESLHDLEAKALAILRGGFRLCGDALSGADNDKGVLASMLTTVDGTIELVRYLVERLLKFLSLAPAIFQINPLRINLARSYRTAPFDYSLAAWSAKDRSIAIICGYLFFALLGVIYLYLAASIRGTDKNGKVESGLADVLYQAGGVMKVILIISIEMIVFPLYCGLLLDATLLPLFADATLGSRMHFMMESPNTSLFIHWFVGTCYMFHFALFVTMCRKIMRNGVLFFIRDPDDPTFHPVRDVLERSVSTQLWKISFSALVYGALVIVCLGGVVWGISSIFNGVFPIRWSSDEPLLEFPVDLLFYNFLLPLAVKYLRPSAGLTKMYAWWFRKCARWLRLTNFLFGEERLDEQGSHERLTWRDYFHGKRGDVSKPVTCQDRRTLSPEEKGQDVRFLRDGKIVLAPSSDQVRIPKGQPTFIELPPEDTEIEEADIVRALRERNPEQFTKVYIPPLFRVRIGLFVCLIWLFAASTGVAITVGPLVLGRFIFSKVSPAHLRMNDIYAFSMGVYILGGGLVLALNCQRITMYIRDALTPHTTTITSTAKKVGHVSVRLLSLMYIYSALTILLPALVSLVIQCYVIIPLHTYFSSHAGMVEVAAGPLAGSDGEMNGPHRIAPRPIIHLMQDWTLGILYVKVFARLILWSAPSRPATALRSIIRNGWLSPDVWLATRGFIIPACVAMGLLLLGPLGVGWIGAKTLFAHFEGEHVLPLVYRYSYPVLMAWVAVVGTVVLAAKAFGRWRRRVRDEVYLIGERLHNYGEARRKKKEKKRRRDKGKGRETMDRPVG
ncbi:MAG: hypothetical protein Q9163_000484 [Psora crenata]